MQIPVTAITAALCALLLWLLAARVSQLRLRHNVLLGDGGVADLNRAIRVHANSVEYIPTYLALSLCYEIYAGAGWYLIGLNLAFLLGRLLFAVGLSLKSSHIGRRVGMLLTYATTLILPLSLLVRAVVEVLQ
jgi:hypothetical protein